LIAAAALPAIVYADIDLHCLYCITDITFIFDSQRYRYFRITAYYRQLNSHITPLLAMMSHWLIDTFRLDCHCHIDATLPGH